MRAGAQAARAFARTAAVRAEEPAILTCAVSGGVVTSNPNQPISREDVIAAALEAARAGASILHIHARTSDGEMTQAPEDYLAIKQAIRRAGGRRRAELHDGWTARDRRAVAGARPREPPRDRRRAGTRDGELRQHELRLRRRRAAEPPFADRGGGRGAGRARDRPRIRVLRHRHGAHRGQARGRGEGRTGDDAHDPRRCRGRPRERRERFAVRWARATPASRGR